MQEKIFSKYNIKIIVIVICTFAAAVSLNMTPFGTAANRSRSLQLLQEGIAEEIIRFHVIGNSDGEADQAVKLKVKQAVVDELRTDLSNTENVAEARSVISERLEDIRNVSMAVLREQGFLYDVHCSLGKSDFPVKVYGDIVLPAGCYEALRIELGAADGKNWWCIMFPQLCFIDCTYDIMMDTSKSKLKYLLTDEEYAAIAQEKPKVKAKLWIVEFLEGIFG